MESLLYKPQILKRNNIEDMLETIVKIPLFILTASIGYGKTTAVRNYLNEHREVESLWFAFGANEMDEMWTWEKMRLTLKESGIPVLQTMAALELPQTFQERLLFINILQRGFEKPTVLVLDDYQEYNGKYLNQLIETLVYEEIPNFHIVIISRVSPEIPFEEMVYKGYCIVMEQQYLLLTQKEMEEFFTINSFALSERESNELYNYTAGWISAIYLALLEFARTGKFENLGGITHLLRTSVFDKMESTDQEILMKMSVFDCFTKEQAAFITKRGDCYTCLQRIARSNGFVVLNMKTGNYEMHGLLKAVAKEEFDRMGYSEKEIYNLAARWHETQNQYLHAIRYYVITDNSDKILEILENNNCYELYARSNNTFVSFFGKLSLEIKIKHPKIYLLFIYKYMIRQDLQKSRELFREAFENQIENTNKKIHKDLLGEIYILKSFTEFNNLESMVLCLKKARGLLGDKPSKVFDAQLVPNYGVPENLYLYYNKIGKLRETVDLLKEYSSYYNELIQEEDAGWSWIYEGEYALDIGEIEKAEEYISLACHKSKFRKRLSAVISSYFARMRCCIILGRKQELFDAIEELKQEMEGVRHSILLQGYEMSIGFIYACIGQFELVPEWIKCFDLSQCSCNNMIKSIKSGYTTYGRILIAEKKYVELEAIAENMQEPYEGTIHRHVILVAKIYESIAAWHLYGKEEGAGFLRQAIEMAEPDRIILPFAENSIELIPILEYIVHKNQNQEYIGTVVVKCKQYANSLKIFEGDRAAKGAAVLTERENEVMQLVIAGNRNTQISETLHIAIVTVEKTLSNVYKKLGVSGRTAAIAKLKG